MATIVQYEGTGALAAFTVSFPYLEQSHVVVKVNGVQKTQDAHYDFTGPSTVTFRPPFIPPANSTVEIARATPTAALVTYQNAAVLTASDLNTAVTQALYISEEIKDRYEYTLLGGLVRLTNGTYVSVQDAIDAATQEVLNSSLLAELQSRISDIDTNAESIITANAEIVDIQAQLDSLDASNGGTAALVAAEAAARVAGDNAIAETIALIGAKSGDNLSFILDLNKVKVSPSESLSTRLSTLASTDAANTAAISSEATTRANADTSLASSITTLQSSVGANTASISTIQSVQNGLVAQYMVKLDVNGHVAGFGLYNSAGTSQFLIAADKFAVVVPGTTKVPFSITGGVCYLQNVVVQDAVIANLTVGKLTTGTFPNGQTFTNSGDFNVGTTGKVRGGKTDYASGTGFFLGYSGGQYVFDIGSTSTYLRWTGSALQLAGADITLNGGSYVRYLGTNVASTYIDWYGPVSVTVNDANAKFYIKKTGESYFGGEVRSSFRPRAWARFYRNSTTGSMYFTRQSNFASLSRIAEGRYQFTFATAQPNKFYVVTANCSNQNNIDAGLICAAYDVTTTGFKLAMQNPAGNYRDTNLGQLVVFGSDEVVTEPPTGYDYEDDPSPPVWNGDIP